MLKQLISTCGDLLYPRNCHICSGLLKGKAGAFDDHLCASCYSTMRETHLVSCIYCGSKLNNDKELNDLCCKDCRQKNHPYQKLLTCYIYEGAVKELIHKFKYGNRPYLCATITKLMTKRLHPDFFRDIDCLVPVPLHPARLREREFNQAELIARDLCSHFNKTLCQPLKRTRNTDSQTSLDQTQRFQNLKGAFILDDPSCVQGKRIAIIDDVVTTAATASAASEVLKDAGASGVFVFAFAKG